MGRYTPWLTSDKMVVLRIVFRLASLLALCSIASSRLRGQAVEQSPTPVPKTRSEMKQVLEGWKLRSPRIPIPTPDQLPETVNNARARRQYLPETWIGPNLGGSSDSYSLDYVFRTELFWIVSRSNNCLYCLGHQEVKLAQAGLADEQIAILDGDWSKCPPAKRVAYGLARKMTLTPHLIQDEDIDIVKKYYTHSQLLEMVYLISSYNSINRWTGGLGLPQDQQFRGQPIRFDAPVSPQWSHRISEVAPLDLPSRPDWEPVDQVRKAWQVARNRQCRIPLDLCQAADVAADHAPDRPSLHWEVALKALPSIGERQIQQWRVVFQTGKLAPLTKAWAAWVTARENRAWYASWHAYQRLRQLGRTDEEIFAYPASGKGDSELLGVLQFVQRLTSQPYSVGDDDVDALKRFLSHQEIAELVFVTAQCNAFDRLTETLALPLEKEEPSSPAKR